MDLVAESAFKPGSPDATRTSTPVPSTLDGEEPHASSSRAAAVDDSDVGSSSSSQGPAGAATLEREVEQVVHNLSSWGGSLWGGLRKQSAFAFESVKKDFSRTVQEAQEDIKKLQTQTVELGLKDLSAEPHSSSSNIGKGKGKETAEPVDGVTPNENDTRPDLPLPTSQNTKDFFTKISETLSAQSHTINASINQNLATLQKSLGESLASASANPQLQSLTRSDVNLAQFSSNIQKNLAQAGTMLNIQQAEKLAEEYFRHAGEFLKDAVKVLPPSDDDEGGIVWDGSDMYSFSTAGQNQNEGLPHDTARSGSLEVSRSQLRKEALLRRLRADKELFLVDPAAETESASRRAAFKAFYKAEIEGKGGIEGEAFEAKIREELDKDGADVEMLKATRDALVPSQLSQQVFWTRYFFHQYAIEDEERKRQQLLQATLEPQAEDFSWDEEDESPTSAEGPSSPAKDEALQNPTRDEPESHDSASAIETLSSPPLPSAGITDSSNTSGRVSEESYVAVKNHKSQHGIELPDKVGIQAAPAATTSKADDDDEDSDWE